MEDTTPDAVVPDTSHVIGLGDGASQAFVYGSYNSIQRVQVLIEQLKEERRLRDNQFSRIMQVQLENKELRRIILAIVAEYHQYAQDAMRELEMATLRENGWQATAAMFHRGQEFYHGLIIRCGDALGEKAFTSLDGSLQADVLALNVPELVEEMCKPKNRFLAALRILFTGK